MNQFILSFVRDRLGPFTHIYALLKCIHFPTLTEIITYSSIAWRTSSPFTTSIPYFAHSDTESKKIQYCYASET